MPATSFLSRRVVQTCSHSIFSNFVVPRPLTEAEQDRLNTQVERSHLWNIGGNVVGYGITDKQVTSGSSGDLALTIYVRKKYPKIALNSSQVIQPEVELEGIDEKILTDVREIGTLHPEGLTVYVRPIPGGYSIGHLLETGTLGCLVVEPGSDSRLLLSNSHVLAASGTAQVGDPIYQPGLKEEDTTAEVVARLLRWQPFDSGEGFTNRVDAALAEPVNQNWFDPIIFNIGRIKGIHVPERGMVIQKSGRSTAHTWGHIEDVNFRLRLSYPRLGGGVLEVSFRDQVLCSRYSDSGDSGALVLDAEGYAVGLHFCGSITASVFSPIQFVLDDLGVELVL